MEETRPFPGRAGWLQAQPMTRADSPGHLIGAWRANLLQCVPSCWDRHHAAGTIARGQNRSRGRCGTPGASSFPSPAG